MLERDIERPFALSVAKMGGLCVKQQMVGIAGFPDRLVLMPSGIGLFIEFKAPHGRLSERQKVVIQKLKKSGHRVEVVSSQTQAESLLEELRKYASYGADGLGGAAQSGD